MHEMFGILINLILCIFQGISFNHDDIVECMHTPQSMFNCCLYKSVLCKYYIVYHKYYKLILSCFL